MSVRRARRRHMQWERYERRFFRLTGHRSKIHNGHANTYTKCMFLGRYYPIGIRREPYVLGATYARGGA